MKKIVSLKLLNPILPIVLLLLIISGCDKKSDCFKYKPKSHNVFTKITINEENQTVPVTVYIGPMEDNNVRYEKDLHKHVKHLTLDTDTYFTIVAHYKLNGKTYRVINGVTLSVSQSGSCFYVENIVVDLRFKP
ncbi:MAG: hypothetical protein PHD00_09150 [Bacteroidales bacterium]|nr:hypothetical protein [Bacteroidales bacterium]MDD4672092.1 hypothetical protein [Bacteroidales bacterium]MDY0348970.1 hypothetical protein [Tenuifilaceae bacterium]